MISVWRQLFIENAELVQCKRYLESFGTSAAFGSELVFVCERFAFPGHGHKCCWCVCGHIMAGCPCPAPVLAQAHGSWLTEWPLDFIWMYCFSERDFMVSLWGISDLIRRAFNTFNLPFFSHQHLPPQYLPGGKRGCVCVPPLRLNGLKITWH